MMLRKIDRELVNLRREEAMACMHYSLYHAATLTAGSGVELLLEFLVGELFDALLADQPQRAEQLRKNWRISNTKKAKLGNGGWEYGVTST